MKLSLGFQSNNFGSSQEIKSPRGIEKGVADGRIEAITAQLASASAEAFDSVSNLAENPFGEELNTAVEGPGLVDPLDELSGGDTGPSRGGAASGLMDAPEIHGIGVGVGIGWKDGSFFAGVFGSVTVGRDRETHSGIAGLTFDGKPVVSPNENPNTKKSAEEIAAEKKDPQAEPKKEEEAPKTEAEKKADEEKKKAGEKKADDKKSDDNKKSDDKKMPGPGGEADILGDDPLRRAIDERMHGDDYAKMNGAVRPRQEQSNPNPLAEDRPTGQVVKKDNTLADPVGPATARRNDPRAAKLKQQGVVDPRTVNPNPIAEDKPKNAPPQPRPGRGPTI